MVVCDVAGRDATRSGEVAAHDKIAIGKSAYCRNNCAANGTDSGAYGDGAPGDPASGVTGFDGAGRYEFAVAAAAVPLGGGTLALNIAAGWEKHSRKGNSFTANGFGWFARARAEQGWQISPVATLADLLGFAREFSRRHYGDALPM